MLNIAFIVLLIFLIIDIIYDYMLRSIIHKRDLEISLLKAIIEKNNEDNK